jgi:NAD(P)-dependent dehydrogenase (short-subunit alcohol dehydrogenase family)
MTSSTTSIRTALVVGGTDGVGKEVARGLLRSGMDVIVVGRDADKGPRAEAELRASAKGGQVQFVACDLSELAEVEVLAHTVLLQQPALHVLVLCAGIVRGSLVLNGDAIESNFMVNYLSRFVLIERLRPLLSASAQSAASRIVLVSGAAQGGTVDFDNVNLLGKFSTVRAVFQTCAANDILTLELARRLALTTDAERIRINCIKLGVVKTAIRRHFPLWMKIVVPLLIDPFLAIPVRQAAEPVLRLAVDPDFAHVTGGLFSVIRKFKRVKADAVARDPANGTKLWDLSERLLERRSSTSGRQPDATLIDSIAKTSNPSLR